LEVVLLFKRERKAELGLAGLAGLQPDAAAMRFDDGEADRQSKS
jgi:hypothetical protein